MLEPPLLALVAIRKAVATAGSFKSGMKVDIDNKLILVCCCNFSRFDFSGTGVAGTALFALLTASLESNTASSLLAI
jgi:Rieske Fe-S protein